MHADLSRARIINSVQLIAEWRSSPVVESMPPCMVVQFIAKHMHVGEYGY